jgi:hypothetical protein
VAGPYSAGSIFLQIIPSFRGVPEAIAAEARGWGKVAEDAGADGGQNYSKAFEKEISKGIPKAVADAHKGSDKVGEESGKAAGKKYAGAFQNSVRDAVRQAQREVQATIKISGDDKELKAKLAGVGAELKALGKAKIGVNLSAESAFATLATMESSLRKLQDQAGHMDASMNIGQAILGVEKIRARIESLQNVTITPEVVVPDRELGALETKIRAAIKAATRAIAPIEIDADLDPAEHRIQQLRAELLALSDRKVGIDIGGATLLAETERIRTELDKLSRDRTVSFHARFDAAEAVAGMAAVQAEADHLDGDTVKIDVDVKAAGALIKLDQIKKEMDHVSGGGESGANAFRAFNGALLGIVALGPAVVPIMAALAGAAGALGPLGAAGIAGIGVAALGLSGVANAVKQLLNVQKNAGQDVRAHEKAVRDANDTVVRSQEAVSRARQSAAQNAVQSARAIETADQGVTNAERSLRDAQTAALQAQQDLTQAREDAVRAERDLQFQLEGGALAYQESLLNVADAQREVDRLRTDPTATPEEIQRASLALQEQQLRVRELAAQNGDLAQKQEEWVKGGVEGSAQVVAAQEKIQTANRNVGDAQQALTDAQRAADQARADAAQQAVQSQQAIADAQRELVKAQENYDTTLQSTTASQRNLNDAMAQLGPASQQFAHFFVDTVIPAFYKLRDVAAEGFLPGLQNWFSVLVGTYGPQIIRIVSGISTALGGMFSLFGQTLLTPPWQAFFTMLEKDGPVFIGMMGQVLANLGTGVISLVNAMVPLSYLFGQWLVDATAAFSRWAQSLSNTAGFQQFLEVVRRDGPLVGQLVMALAGAFLNLAQALLPYAEQLIKVLTGVLNWIAGMDPGVLGAIATAIIGIVLAFQVLVGLTAGLTGFVTVINIAKDAMILFGISEGVVASAGAAIAGVVIIIVAAAAAIGVGLYLAYTHFKWFHDLVDAIWQAIQAAAKVVIDWFMNDALPVLQEVWKGIATAAQWYWENILQPIFTLMGHIFGDIWTGMQWAWKNIGEPLFHVIGMIVQVLWTDIIQPIFTLLAPLFEGLWTSMKVAWMFIGKPIFDAIIAVIGFLWDYVVKPIFIIIGVYWSVLVKGIEWAWTYILKPVFDIFGVVIKNLWVILKPVFDLITGAWGDLGHAFSDIYHKVIEPIWDIFKGALQKLADFFGITKETIKHVWDAIKVVIATPINFVIGVIFNKGLFAAWNWIVKNLGLPDSWHAGPWPQIQGEGIPQFASGGKIPGPYRGAKADNVYAQVTGGGMVRVNPKEYIHPVDSVDYYGLDFMDAIRKKQIPREMLGLAGGGQIPSLAGGGPVASTWGTLWSIVKRTFPDSILTSGYRPGSDDWHGKGDAIDVSFAGNAQSRLMPLAAWIAQNYPGSTELIHNPNASIKNGRPVSPSFWGAATWDAHANHVHWAETPAALLLPGANTGATGDAQGGVVDWLGRVWHNVTDVFSSLKDSIKDVASIATKFGQSPIVQGIAGAPGALLGHMWDAAKDKVATFFASVFSDDSNTPGDAGGLKEQAYNVAQLMYGWNTAADRSALDFIGSHESGWNPKAQNQNSTASGIWQHIDGTWRTYRPLEASGYAHMKDAPSGMQDKAGMRYIHDRYGTPAKAMAHWQSAHSYGSGGEVVPDLMDWGGYIMPGLNVIMNRTRRPEPVINPQTLDSLITIADGGAGGGLNPVIGTLNQYLQNVTSARQVASEVDHAATVARRGGKY